MSDTLKERIRTEMLMNPEDEAARLAEQLADARDHIRELEAASRRRGAEARARTTRIDDGAVRVYRDGKHRPDCDAVRMVETGRWPTAWALSHAVRATPSGRLNRRGAHMWVEFRCNDRDCAARLRVHADDLAYALEATR